MGIDHVKVSFKFLELVRRKNGSGNQRHENAIGVNET